MAINQASVVLKPIVDDDLQLFQGRIGAVDSEELLEKCERIKDSDGRTALHLAAYFHHTEICKYLIEDVGMNINIKDDKGYTPLFLAVKEKYHRIATYLILKGADVNEKNKKGKSAIHTASKKGFKELVDLLITHHADIEAIYDQQTPLQFAASIGNKVVVEMLLKHNANPDSASSFALTPLMLSIDAGSVDCVKLLLGAGADSNKSSHGVDPLVFAALRVKDTQFIRLLLDAGADPKRRDMTSLTPLEHAIRAGNNDGAAILFPLTSRDPSVSDWSIDGITMHIHSEERKNQRELEKEETFVSLKERGEAAFERKDHWTAVRHYTQALFIKPRDAIVLSKRFLCWARLRRSTRLVRDAVDCVSNANGVEHPNIRIVERQIQVLEVDGIVAGLQGKPEPRAYKAMRKAFE